MAVDPDSIRARAREAALSTAPLTVEAFEAIEELREVDHLEYHLLTLCEMPEERGRHLWRIATYCPRCHSQPGSLCKCPEGSGAA